MTLNFAQTGISPHRSSPKELGGVWRQSAITDDGKPAASGNLAAILNLSIGVEGVGT